MGSPRIERNCLPVTIGRRIEVAPCREVVTLAFETRGVESIQIRLPSAWSGRSARSCRYRAAASSLRPSAASAAPRLYRPTSFRGSNATTRDHNETESDHGMSTRRAVTASAASSTSTTTAAEVARPLRADAHCAPATTTAIVTTTPGR